MAPQKRAKDPNGRGHLRLMLEGATHHITTGRIGSERMSDDVLEVISWNPDGGVLELFADPTRIGQSTDHTGREVLISCGAVLDHFRVAMAAAGWEAYTDRFPNPTTVITWQQLVSAEWSSSPTRIGPER